MHRKMQLKYDGKISYRVNAKTEKKMEAYS